MNGKNLLGKEEFGNRKRKKCFQRERPTLRRGVGKKMLGM